MKVLVALFLISAFYVISCGEGAKEQPLCQENQQQNCTTTCGTQGTQGCQNGQWTPCKPPFESCNGQDDNCDGQIDEGLQQPCSTACGAGKQLCEGGKWSECDAKKPQAEVCNNTDDDCDGKIDEDVDGQPLKKPCDNECGKGFESCYYGTWANCDAPTKEAEKCDGKDNDCDKQIDEELVQECKTACGSGIEKCKDGKWVECSAPQPTAETCNGKDDDCNGKIDDGIVCTCTEGAEQKCGTDEGECVPGIQKCTGGKWGDCGGPTYVGPKDEDCNNKDDNCNGATDEGLIKECETPCAKGKQTCTNGFWSDCDAPKPSPEICDGKDNDCNGKIDDGMDVDKYENNETCETARKIDDIGENAEPIVVNATIYPEKDVDWLNFKTNEISDLTPACCEGSCWNPLNPHYDGCYYVIVTLKQPDSSMDYDLCVSGGDCQGKLTNNVPICKNNPAGKDEEVVLVWKGGWGSSDNIDFFVKIFAKDNKQSSCKNYSFTYEFYNDTEAIKKVKKDNKEFCLCPWEEGYPSD